MLIVGKAHLRSIPPFFAIAIAGSYSLIVNFCKYMDFNADMRVLCVCDFAPYHLVS